MPTQSWESVMGGETSLKKLASRSATQPIIMNSWHIKTFLSIRSQTDALWHHDYSFKHCKFVQVSSSLLQYCIENKSPNEELCPAPEGGCRYAMFNENGGWCQLTGDSCDWKDRKKKNVTLVDTKAGIVFTINGLCHRGFSLTQTQIWSTNERNTYVLECYLLCIFLVKSVWRL